MKTATSGMKVAWSLALVLALRVSDAPAQDANITQSVPAVEKLFAAEPLVIAQAEISRPKAQGDITLRADVSFGGAPPVRVKLRHAEPGADSFNNVPRYDIAAYALQGLFLDPSEYVVPPTTLRWVNLEDFAKYAPKVERTFPGADQVLAVVQYWLNDVRNAEDIYSAETFAADPVYARHIGQLNLFTYLINHRDSNLGNFLIGRSEKGARVFSIDNGVAFDSPDADRGELWKVVRVERLPRDAVERLRKLTPELLQQRLGVLAQWKLEDRRYVPMPLGENLAPGSGVRRGKGVVQMGLTQREISQVNSRLKKLMQQVDAGKFKLVPEGP